MSFLICQATSIIYQGSIRVGVFSAFSMMLYWSIYLPLSYLLQFIIKNDILWGKYFHHLHLHVCLHHSWPFVAMCILKSIFQVLLKTKQNKTPYWDFHQNYIQAPNYHCFQIHVHGIQLYIGLSNVSVMFYSFYIVGPAYLFINPFLDIW